MAIYDASGSDIDPTAEWPTRASYLIYEMFSAMTGWIETVRILQPGSPHLVPVNDNLTHENGNIPKSAALALGSCLEFLLTADSVSERFKEYIHDIVIRTMRHKSKGGLWGRHRAILIKSIIQGGLHQPTHDYGEALKRLWQSADHVVRADIPGYEAKLLQAYP